MKNCSTCKLPKAEGEFYALPRFICKACVCERNRRWKVKNRTTYLKQQAEAAKRRRLANPEKYKEVSRKWYMEHPGAMKAARKKNREKYPGIANARVREWRKSNPYYEKNRRRADPQFRMAGCLRSRLLIALKAGGAKKAASTFGLLGCSREFLRNHLESQFKPGMTWENHGPVWHIDHIKPCAKFDLTNPEQQRICFHWTNLQPLFAEDNLRKSAT